MFNTQTKLSNNYYDIIGITSILIKRFFLYLIIFFLFLFFLSFRLLTVKRLTPKMLQITKKEKFERKFIVFTFATSQLCWVPSSPRLSFSFQHFLFVSFSLSLLLNLLWEFLRAAGLFFLRLVALLETNTYFLHMKYLFLILYF